MTKQKLSYKKLLKGQWCPLFGVLPSFPRTNENREIADRCNGIIEQARLRWGIFDNDMVDDPWPALADIPISMYREHGREACDAARALFSCLDEIAWKTGTGVRIEIEGRDLGSAMETYPCDVRHALREHLISEVNKVWCRYFPEGLDPQNPSSLRLVYSLFAIHESWHILKWLCSEMDGGLLMHIAQRIHYAEGLLAAADHMAELEEKEGLQILAVKQKGIENKREEGIQRRGRITKMRNDIIRKMASELYENAKLDNRKVAVYKDLSQQIYDRIITPSFRSFIKNEYPTDAIELIKSFQRKRIKSVSSIAHIINHPIINHPNKS
jgi:hypothetical protein